MRGPHGPLDLNYSEIPNSCLGVALSLDLSDTTIQPGTQMGVTFTVDTDAHTPSGFTFLRSGLDEARRAWLEKGDVLNTKSADGLVQAWRSSS